MNKQTRVTCFELPVLKSLQEPHKDRDLGDTASPVIAKHARNQGHVLSWARESPPTLKTAGVTEG